MGRGGRVGGGVSTAEKMKFEGLGERRQGGSTGSIKVRGSEFLQARGVGLGRAELPVGGVAAARWGRPSPPAVSVASARGVLAVNTRERVSCRVRRAARMLERWESEEHGGVGGKHPGGR